MASKVECQQLFREFRHAYQDWMDKHAEYRKQLVNPSPTNRASSFKGSQFIEWNGTPYNCIKNNTQWSCTMFSSPQHEKAKCQQLYMDRPHLHAPCDPTGSLYTEELTQARCKEKGYLTHNGLDEKLEALVSGSEPLVEPTLQLPEITCETCAPEFQRLANDFSYENLSKVAKCIEFEKPTTTSAPTPATPATPATPSTTLPTTVPPTTLAPPSEENNMRQRNNTRETKDAHENDSNEEEPVSLYTKLKDNWMLVAIGVLTFLLLCSLFKPAPSRPQQATMFGYRMPNHGLVNYDQSFTETNQKQFF